MPPGGPSNLVKLVETASEVAKAKGILSSIPTRLHYATEAGLTFKIRLVEALQRKPPGESGEGAKAKDPFHEPEKTETFVKKLSPTHSLLLNKFNVVPNHVLVVTNEFRPQTEPLLRDDFLALLQCLPSLNALAFYNCGPNSGASQPHKHMQLIPRDFELPLEQLMLQRKQSQGLSTEVFRLPELPFKHAATLLQSPSVAEGEQEEASSERAEELEASYHRLLAALKLDHRLPDHPTARQSYNFLLTSDWMFVVERVQETIAGVSVNSVGYSGTILVKTEEQLAIVQEKGPLSILKQGAATHEEAH